MMPDGLNLPLHFRQTRLSVVLRRHICQSHWLFPETGEQLIAALETIRQTVTEHSGSPTLVAGFRWWAPCHRL